MLPQDAVHPFENHEMHRSIGSAEVSTKLDPPSIVWEKCFMSWKLQLKTAGLVTITAVATLGTFALALQGTAFPVNSPDLNVGWDVHQNGGLVLKGNNKVAPTLKIQNTRDGIGPRQPVFVVTGRTEQQDLDTAQSLVRIESVENAGSVGIDLVPEAREDDKLANREVTLMVTRDGKLLLRQNFKQGNWRKISFFEFDLSDYCPGDLHYPQPGEKVTVETCN